MTAEAAQRELYSAPRRYKVRFPDAASFAAASSLESLDLSVAVSSPKRRFFTLSVPPAFAGVGGFEKALEQRLEFFAANYGAKFAEDYRWDLDMPPASFTDPDGGGPSLDDVLDSIKAREAWRAAGNRGGGATIAVVDTGVSGRRPELAPSRRVSSWQAAGTRQWTDPVGHGTMCAVIAAGNRSSGGRFDGVAPEARLIACRTRFFDSELAAIYDRLAGLVRSDPDLRLVVTNSFGRRMGSSEPPPDSEFPAALEEAVAAGMAVLFSAGNNHQLAGGRPEQCRPCTIWNHKLRGDVLTVGACDLKGELWDYSSRGPSPRAGPAKPDLVAPVPRRGLVAFGDEDRRFPFGWGTSGACPQAAGLAALLWTAEPDLATADLFGLMRNGAGDLGRAPSCQGTGQLDCLGATSLSV